ncbi:hypothetical protein [Micromonospora sp. NPDC048830]|uniref:hypothetical protein n=1 Tax=Micromonospora sp. NPDC048830 TaxID=3364257 RepID=UPI00371F7FA9
MTDPAQSLAGALAALDRAADHFWSFMEDRSVRFVPSQVAPIFFATLGHLVTGRDGPAGRRAGLAVLGRLYRRFGLCPYHGTVIAAAMVDTVRRFAGGSWEPELAEVWERGCRRVLRLAERAGVVGDEDAPGAALWASDQRPSPVGELVPTGTAAGNDDVRPPRSAT